MSGWEEAKINSSNPLRYDRQSGGFVVTRAGLYYLYCQVSPARPPRAQRAGTEEEGVVGGGAEGGGQLGLGLERTRGLRGNVKLRPGRRGPHSATPSLSGAL